MFEPVKDQVFVEDGCSYLSEGEMQAFSEMVTPSQFDPSAIKHSTVNVQYGTLPEQLLDIYKPDAGEGPFPVVFYVHGGGWVEGSKTLAPLQGIIGLIDHGYVVISVDYRLAPATKFPEFLFDIKTAVRWARAHAGAYGFDPKRFGMIGDSAGGHLTLMMGFTAGHPEYAGEAYGWAGESDELQAICDMYGLSTLVDPMTPFYLESGVPRAMRDIQGEPTLFDRAFGTDNADLLKLISPLSYIHRNVPPVLILHGKKDGIVPYQHSTILKQKIDKICGEGRAELILYDDRNHADYDFNKVGNSDTAAKFFDRYLK